MFQCDCIFYSSNILFSKIIDQHDNISKIYILSDLILFLAGQTWVNGKNTYAVVPASTSLIDRSKFHLKTVPSSSIQLLSHRLHRISTYDYRNIPTLKSHLNHLANPFQHRFGLAFVNKIQPKGLATFGVSSYQQRPQSVPATPASIHKNQKVPFAMNISMPEDLLLRHMDNGEKVMSMLNILRSGNPKKMILDLSRFKVYQAVPDAVF